MQRDQAIQQLSDQSRQVQEQNRQLQEQNRQLQTPSRSASEDGLDYAAETEALKQQISMLQQELRQVSMRLFEPMVGCYCATFHRDISLLVCLLVDSMSYFLPAV